MANDLYIYTTPPESTVHLRLDSGQELTGVPGLYNGRTDGHLIQIPADVTTGRGGELSIMCDGYLRFSVRGLVVPSATGPAQLFLDDVHLDQEPEPVAPPDPVPPASSDPLGIINAVYATGAFNLVTIEGCGQFTEECCRQLVATFGQRWGHVAKSPGQNQYNKHAVDALMCLPGEYDGIWDIIYSSASSQAKPVFNRAGDVKPQLWRPPEPLPCTPA